MDIVSHALFGYSVFNSISKTNKILLGIMFVGALCPDIGEIVIQNELATKFGETIAVYDSRTSDLQTASNIKVTFLYDFLHSLVFPSLLLVITLFLKKNKIKKHIIFFIIGLYSHIFLDCFTHGKIWCLKLFYPISITRFPILSDTIGNWWDWSPKVNFGFIKLPIYCVLFWLILITLNIYKFKRKQIKP
jgi:membrane-bound metal-dependent hydrolase YbcI (DUF457 family)